MKYLFALFILIPSLTFGQVKYLTKDTPAPFSGYLFTPEMEKELRQHDIDLKQSQDLSAAQRDLLIVKDQKLENQAEQISNLNSQITNSGYMKWIYFGIGVLTTGAAVYLSKQVK